MPSADPFHNLGVHIQTSGGEIRVFSAHATAMELCIFDRKDPNWISRSIPMARDDDGVWSAKTRYLKRGTWYSVRTSGPTGPTHAFDPRRHLIDPYARGLGRGPTGEWRGYVQDNTFNWGKSTKPNIALDHTVLYEAHVKGMTKLNLEVPENLRGTYGGIAHESTIAYLKQLGVTGIQLLPVQQFVSEERLLRQGRVNYWGYNTLNFFTPHAAYATREAQKGGTGAVLREFKNMVKALHSAGLEVIMDVVYNHTAEEGPGGPTTSFRGIDNSTYYRQTVDGHYIDVTGCGNTLNFAAPVAQRLVIDSLKYWANQVQVDGFRFDLAASLGRDGNVHFDPLHPLLTAIVGDPELAGVKMIAEPWDIGMGGWQVGQFPHGWSEWNDGFRDRMRDFWLSDIAAVRSNGVAPNGIGSLARRLAGSAHVFSQERGPLASVNFITAHDGFTVADLTAYNVKHNLGNGEKNQDGTDTNHSFNHGVEGPTDDIAINENRCRAMRNLLGTLLLSAGVPMLTSGDEFGKSQRGNNNVYNQDSELSWLPWEHENWQDELLLVTQQLIRLREENPALRPVRFGKWGETVKSATQMDWYNKQGLSMTLEDWDSPAERTLQYLAASTPEFEAFNRILLVVHGQEYPVTVTLPKHTGVKGYTRLWDSSVSALSGMVTSHAPGSKLTIAATSMQLFRAY